MCRSRAVQPKTSRLFSLVLVQEVETERASARIREYVVRMLAGIAELPEGGGDTQDYNLLQKLVAARDLTDQSKERNKLSTDEVSKQQVDQVASIIRALYKVAVSPMRVRRSSPTLSRL